MLIITSISNIPTHILYDTNSSLLLLLSHQSKAHHYRLNVDCTLPSFDLNPPDQNDRAIEPIFHPHPLQSSVLTLHAHDSSLQWKQRITYP